MTPHPTCQIPNLQQFIDTYLPDGKNFVEVGAFDGMTYSNTWHLANAGWEGLYIEAHPDFAQQCYANHAENNVYVVDVACGSSDGETHLIIYGECSTVNLSDWNKQWGMNEQTPKIKVPVYTLNRILQENNFGNIDLLVIDVEEAEIEVLRGFTVEQYKPRMIIIELHEGQGTLPHQKGYQEPWVTKYLGDNYKKVYFDNINTIYVRK